LYRCGVRQLLQLPGWTWGRFSLLLIDNIISGLLIGPLVVFYWRGTYTLMYLNIKINVGSDEQSSFGSGWICLAVGNVGLMLLIYCQHFLNRHLKVNRVTHWLIGYHVYMYVAPLFNCFQWVGVWTLLDDFTGTQEVSLWTSVAIGISTCIEHNTYFKISHWFKL